MPSGFAPLARPRKLRAAASRVHGGVQDDDLDVKIFLHQNAGL